MSVSYTHLDVYKRQLLMYMLLRKGKKVMQSVSERGFSLSPVVATGGTHRFLEENGISSTRVYRPSEEDMEPQALTMLHERKIDMVVNIPPDLSAGELNNGYKIRRAAIDLNIPLITNARLASAFIEAFCTLGRFQKNYHRHFE